MKLNIPTKTALILLMLLLAASSFGAAYFFYSKYQKAQKILKDPSLVANKEANLLVSKVGKLIELPTDEEPTVATVIDAQKLKDQLFFAKAKNGDKVLLYTNARKAILYDPKENKIIEVAPINIGAQGGTPSPQVEQPPPKTKVALYNGTPTADLTRNAEEIIEEKFTNFEIAAKTNAKKNDYEKTLIIDLAGNNADKIQELAREFKAKVGSLPEGETAPPTGEILIIIGKEFNQ